MTKNQDQSVEINHNQNWFYIHDHPCIILITFGSLSGKTNVLLNSKHSFYEYYNIKNYSSLSFESKYTNLLSFYRELNKFNNLNPKKERTKEKKLLCMMMLQNYAMSIQESILMNTSLFQMLNSFFKTHNYDVQFENKESTHQKESVDLYDISPLECDK